MGHNQAVLKMKAFVAVVAALCASAKAQYPFYPYAGYHGYAGYGYGAGLPIAHAAYAPAAVAPAAIAPATVATYAAAAPVIAPAAIAAPAPSVSSQFHSQDEFGNTAHGYANINSAKHEQGNGYLGVTGSYSYVDANGELQTTNYIADGLGLRVQATNLPQAPVFEGKAPEAPVFEGKAPVFDLVGPAPVEDTEEVKLAKLEFQAKFDEAAAREKRSTPAATEAIEPLKVVAPAFAPFTYAGAYAPYTYAAGAFAPYTYGAYAAPYTYAGAYAAPYGYAGLAPYTFPAAAPVDYSVVPAINIPVAPLAEEKAEE